MYIKLVLFVFKFYIMNNKKKALQLHFVIFSFTEGRWKVVCITNKNRHAGTQAQVTLTVYGHKGNSGPISLGTGDGENFQSGTADEFDVRYHQIDF